MEEQRNHRVDILLFLLATAMALALPLLASKLGATVSGKRAVLILLVALFACLIKPVLQVNWLSERCISWIGVVIAAAAVSCFGFYVWPITLSVSPNRATFGARSGFDESYDFTVKNNSDAPVYAAAFLFHISSESLYGNSFALDVPKSSRKPLGENNVTSNHWSDILGFACHEDTHRPFFAISVARLASGESREITITRTRPGSATILATPDFFSFEARPVEVSPIETGQDFRFNEVLENCRALNFAIDDSSTVNDGRRVIISWGSLPGVTKCNAVLDGSPLIPWTNKYWLTVVCGFENAKIDKFDDTSIAIGPFLGISAQRTQISFEFSDQMMNEVKKLRSSSAPGINVWYEAVLLPKELKQSEIHELSDVPRYGGVILSLGWPK